MERKEKSEEKKTSSDKKGKKSGAHRKNAVAACQVDLSCLNVPPEVDGYGRGGLKRSSSERRTKTDRQGLGEGAVPKGRPCTEKLRRKFKSSSNKPDLDSLGVYAGIDNTYEQNQSKTSEAKSKSVTNLKEEVIIAVDVVKKVSRSDKEIVIHNEVDIRKQTRIPNQDSELDNIIHKTDIRRSKSEVVNPLEVFLTQEDTERVKKKVDTIQIRSSSEDLIDEIMQDMYKQIDIELLQLDLFDSHLNVDKVEFQRSSSFGVANDFKQRHGQWFTKPVFKQSFSSEEKLSDQGVENLDDIKETTREIFVKEKRKVFQQRLVSDRSRKQSEQGKVKEDIKQASTSRGNEDLRRKSRSQEHLRRINEEFQRVLQESASQRYRQDDDGCSGSSAEDILHSYPKGDKILKARRKGFAQNSMDSIDEHVESPPSSPRMATKKDFLTSPAKSKTEKKRKISTGKKIIDKIKTEITRKISGGEKAPNGEEWHDKIKREKSFEKLRNKKREIDKKFQKWIDFVVCLHVSNFMVNKKPFIVGPN